MLQRHVIDLTRDDVINALRSYAISTSSVPLTWTQARVADEERVIIGVALNFTDIRSACIAHVRTVFKLPPGVYTCTLDIDPTNGCLLGAQVSTTSNKELPK